MRALEAVIRGVLADEPRPGAPPTFTPEQRRQALQDLSAEVPEEERATDDDPRSLARMATRAW